jgi:hypothetical protein
MLKYILSLLVTINTSSLKVKSIFYLLSFFYCIVIITFHLHSLFLLHHLSYYTPPPSFTFLLLLLFLILFFHFPSCPPIFTGSLFLYSAVGIHITCPQIYFSALSIFCKHCIYDLCHLVVLSEVVGSTTCVLVFILDVHTATVFHFLPYTWSVLFLQLFYSTLSGLHISRCLSRFQLSLFYPLQYPDFSFVPFFLCLLYIS